MEKLFKGVVKFKKTDFEDHKEHFENLGRKQTPHTLFIGCSDSRVVPTMITKTLPGDLFLIRNVANIVPFYQQAEAYYSTTSAIEYAVNVLEVETIVVCGHSNCGGCAALYNDPSTLDELPHTRNWLKLAEPVKEKVLAQVPEGDEGAREWLTEQMNVVEQMKHLATYPFIEKRYKEGKLKILGWHYIIETGEVFNYNPETEEFELIS